MPRYLIERKFSITDKEMPKIGRRSNEIIRDDAPVIVWEHSHVLLDDEGNAMTYCVYEAPDEETVRKHAENLSDYSENTYSIREIVGDVSPADFPLDGSSPPEPRPHTH